jgi:hypothetical protein
MALSQNEPNAIVCCEDSQIYGLSGICPLPKVRLEESVVVCCQGTPDPSFLSHLHNQTHTNYESYSYCPVDLTLDENTTVRGTLGQIPRGMAPATLSLAHSDFVHDLPIVRDLW